MRRRSFVAFIGFILAAPLASIAQQGKIPRVGFLISETFSGQASRVDALRAGLRELGYVEGKNIMIELRPAGGNYGRLPALATELIDLKVDVLVAFGGKAVLAAKAATTTIPIVVPSSGDPVAMGIVGGLAHPGGNITGNAMFSMELSAKRIEILKEALPRIVRVGAVLNAANPSSRLAFDAMRAAAEASKLELREFKLRSPKELDSIFSEMAKGRIGAIVVSTDTFFQANAKAIADLAAKRRLPAVGAAAFADAGGLIGYGVNDAALYTRAAYFVDRILKGAKPAELPVERPTRFELVVNMKTAKALGVKIPQTLLVRADRVIE